MSDQPPPENPPPPRDPSPGGYPPPGNYPPQGGYPPGNYPPQGGYPPGNYPPPGGYPQQGGYAQQGGYPQPPPSQPQNTAGIVAVVLAILGIVLCWTILGGIIFGSLAVVLGFIGRSKSKKGTATNGTISLLSIILGLVAVALSIVLLVIGLGLFNRSGGRDFADCIARAGNDQSEQQQCADKWQQNIEDRFDVTIPNEPN